MDNPQTIIMQYQSQVLDLQGAVEKLKAELTKLTVEIGQRKLNDEVNSRIAEETTRRAVKAEAELAQAKAENEELSKLASLKLARGRIKDLQAENARLAAALAMCKLIADTHKPHAEGCDCLQCVPFERMHDHASEPNNALRDLLAPTIELIKEQLKIGMLPERRVLFEKELSRLRSIRQGKP